MESLTLPAIAKCSERRSNRHCGRIRSTIPEGSPCRNRPRRPGARPEPSCPAGAWGQPGPALRHLTRAEGTRRTPPGQRRKPSPPRQDASAEHSGTESGPPPSRRLVPPAPGDRPAPGPDCGRPGPSAPPGAPHGGRRRAAAVSSAPRRPAAGVGSAAALLPPQRASGPVGASGCLR